MGCCRIINKAEKNKFGFSFGASRNTRVFSIVVVQRLPNPFAPFRLRQDVLMKHIKYSKELLYIIFCSIIIGICIGLMISN